MLSWLMIHLVTGLSKNDLKSYFMTEEYQQVDRFLGSVDFEFKLNQVGSKILVSVDPVMDGMAVLNSRRYFYLEEGRLESVKRQETTLLTKRSWQEPDIISTLQMANNRLGYDFFSDSVHYEPVWFAKDATLHYAFNVKDPNQGMIESWNWILNSNDGSILHSYPAKLNERGIVFPPGSTPSFGKTPSETELPDVFPGPATSIKGKDFQSSNSCFAYNCPKGLNCTMDNSVCVDITKEMKEDVDYFAGTSYIATDGRQIDYDYDWQANGYKNNIVYLGWKNAPVGTSRLKKPANGIWGSDVDFTKLTGTEQTDSFAELQMYYYLTSHADFMRKLLQNPNFCFDGSGPNCTNINSQNETVPEASPIRYFVNYQTMKASPDPGSAHPDLITQIKRGLGKNLTDPIMFYESDDYPDAYYSRGQNFTKRTCEGANCLLIDNYPYTHFAFGQSTKYDWALNECIAYHELTHAVVGQFIPTLPSYTWTKDGLKSDPGAMNEGWADYFAAIHCGISDFRKTYNGKPNRDMNAEITCANTVGEVHADGILFSGALWKIRNQIPQTPPLASQNQPDFDRVVLEAMSLGTPDDLFETQFNSVLSILSKHSTLNPMYSFAKSVFEQRLFNCTRTTLFKESSDPTFVLPHPAISAANLSTIPTTLKFSPRASDWSATLKWRQWAQNPWFGPLDTGYGKSLLPMLVSNCPIKYKGTTKQNITGYTDCNGIIDLDWKYSTYNDKYGYFSFNFNGGDAYLVIANEAPTSMYLYSSSVTFYGFNMIWRYTFVALGSLSLVFFGLCFYLFMKTSQKTVARNYLIQLTGLLFGVLGGVFAVLALIFGIIREYFTMAMFIPRLVCNLMMFLHMRKTKTPLAGWLNYSLAFQAVFTVIGLIIVILTTSTLVVHAIVYSLFLLANISTITLWLMYFLSRLRNTEAEPEELIQMEAL